MVHVLFFSDRQVRDKLFALVAGTRGLLLVKGVRHGRDMRPPEEREPFDTLEASVRTLLPTVVVLATMDAALFHEHADQIAALAASTPVAVAAPVDEQAMAATGAEPLVGQIAEAAASLVGRRQQR